MLLTLLVSKRLNCLWKILLFNSFSRPAGYFWKINLDRGPFLRGLFYQIEFGTILPLWSFVLFYYLRRIRNYFSVAEGNYVYNVEHVVYEIISALQRGKFLSTGHTEYYEGSLVLVVYAMHMIIPFGEGS